MKQLVIGGMGFIGYNLVKELIREGHEVWVYDRNCIESRKHSECAYIFDELENIRKYPEIFEELYGVYHLIHTTVPQSSNENIIYDAESNILGTIQLLDACVEKRVKKVVYASSGGTVYGIPEYSPIDEGHPTNPICAYGISKLAIEKYLKLYFSLYGLNYKIARISNPYGPFQVNSSQGIIGVLLNKIIKKETVEIWGDGSATRDYIYIKDLADALKTLMIYDNNNHHTYNIGSGLGTSVNQLIELLCQVTGQKVDVRYKDKREFDVPHNVLDIKKMVSDFQWKPRYDIKEGIREAWGWKKSEKI